MSETKHSPEPWRYEGDDEDGMVRGFIVDASGEACADGHAGDVSGMWVDGGEDGAQLDPAKFQAACEANARRIVAAVNAVAGISTEALESGALGELIEAAAGAHYCATCRDNPSHKLCDKHLRPLGDALRRLGSIP